MKWDGNRTVGSTWSLDCIPKILILSICLPISQQQSQAARSPKISDLHTNNILQGMLLCGDIVQKTAVKTAHLEAYWLHAMHWNWKKKKKIFFTDSNPGRHHHQWHWWAATSRVSFCRIDSLFFLHNPLASFPTISEINVFWQKRTDLHRWDTILRWGKLAKIY